MNEMILTPSIREVGEIYARNGFSIWLVGGAVRDSLLGEVPKDIDFATDATPDEQIELCERENLKFIPTGLKHGTVTVIHNSEQYEITTLRTESNHDGRHADVAFTRRIEDDLSRRDLTINAMAMDMDGNLIDPFDGQRDLAARKVRFVGSADERMREDYLRILRWLRFHARISPGLQMDSETVDAAMRCASGLRGISRERVWSEISKTLTYDGGINTIQAMHDLSLSVWIDLPFGDIGQMRFSSDYTRDPVTLIAQYLRRKNGSVERLAAAWKWSTYDRKKAELITEAANKCLGVEEIQYRVAVWNQPLDILIEARRSGGMVALVEELSRWDAPTFPVTGADLIKLGAEPGPDMGRDIAAMKDRWARSNFTLTKEELLRAYNPKPYPDYMYQQTEG